MIEEEEIHSFINRLDLFLFLTLHISILKQIIYDFKTMVTH